MSLEKLGIDIGRIADAMEALVEGLVNAEDHDQQVSDVANNSHIEAKIPASQGGAMVPSSRGKATTSGDQVHTGPHNTAIIDTNEPFKGTDKTDRVWDARIDSSNGKRTGKGVWQARRNVPDDIRAAVITELLAAIVPAANQTPATQSPGEPLQTPAATSVATIVPTTLKELQHSAQGVLQALGPDVSKITELLARWHVPNLSSIPLAHYPQFHGELLATLEPQG